MVEGSTRVGDPDPHQPSNAYLKQHVTVAATSDMLAWAVTRGRAEQQVDSKLRSP